MLNKPLWVRSARSVVTGLSISTSTPYAVFQGDLSLLNNGIPLTAEHPLTLGMCAQPTAEIVNERVCFHGDHPKTVEARVLPEDFIGSSVWSWNNTGSILTPNRRTTNVTWGDGSPELKFELQINASAVRSDSIYVTKCSLTENTWCDEHHCEHSYCACDNANAAVDEYCGYHGQLVSECGSNGCPTHNCPVEECPVDWCHTHGCLYTECGCHDLGLCPTHNCPYSECPHGDYPENTGIVGSAEEDDEAPGNDGPYGFWPIAVNNNDDDGDGKLDHHDDDGVIDDSNLVVICPISVHNGSCCPCPEHYRNPEITATLSECSANLKTWADAAKTIGKTSVSPGEVVYVEGFTPSTHINADKIVWEWRENDEDRDSTITFTVFSLRMFADLDYNDIIDSADYAGISQLTDHGWIIPVASNKLHKVLLKNDVNFSGDLILSLTGDAQIRIWTTATPSATDIPLLVTGQTVTNGIDGASFVSYPESVIYVECTNTANNGGATLYYSYKGNDTIDAAAGMSCGARLDMTAVRVDIAMDGNRDGEIDFDDPEDKEYLFWVNNDYDVEHFDENDVQLQQDDNVSGDHTNCDDDTIGNSVLGGGCERDLEDFTRLNIRVGENTASLPGVTYWIRFGLTPSSPSVNIFEAVDGTTSYLTDINQSSQQIKKNRINSQPVTEVERQIDNQFIKANGETTTFLLEGCSVGEGDLTFVVKVDGEEFCSESVFLELKDISFFYKKYTATVTGQKWDAQVSSTATPPTGGDYLPETDEMFLFVHGWNMSPATKTAWAETVFKRLWWQGYKGGVALFDWPTLYDYNAGVYFWQWWDLITESHHFDNSEYISWLSADALIDVFSELNANGKLRVLAHSMGNVVTASALHKYPETLPPLHTYIAAQAAISAHYYDNGVYANEPAVGVTIETPDVMGHYSDCLSDFSYPPYMDGKTNNVTYLFNYHNYGDFALRKWNLNNHGQRQL